MANLNAKDIKPTSTFNSVGFVNDFVVDSDTLYVANDMGTIDVFDLKNHKIINQIILPPLTSSMNKIIPADILSVDYLDGKVLILSVGSDSSRNVWIYEKHTLNQIINEDKKLTIKEARFINSEQIFLATLDSDIILYDLSENYAQYNTHKSDSALSDIAISDDKKTIFMADESGTVKVIDLLTSKTLQTYASQNVDNIYKVASNNGVTLTAGQDKRVGVYSNTDKPYYIKSDFLVFCVGLSPSGKIGVYSSGQSSDLQLFNTKTKSKYDRLIGHDGVVNKILFTNENEIYSSQRGRSILYWRLD